MYQICRSLIYKSKIKLTKSEGPDYLLGPQTPAPIHDPLITSRPRQSDIFYNRQFRQRSENIALAHGNLQTRHHAEEAEVLMRLNGVKVGGALDNIKKISDGVFVDLIHSHRQQRFRSEVVRAVADADANSVGLGNNDHDHEAAAASGVHQIAAVGDVGGRG